MTEVTVTRTLIDPETGEAEDSEETFESTYPNVQLGSDQGLWRRQLLPGESVTVEVAEEE